MASLVEQQQLFMWMFGQLISFVYRLDGNFGLRGGDLWRNSENLICPGGGAPHSYQAQLVAAGLSKTMASLHGDRLAVDLLLMKANRDVIIEDYRLPGEFWERLNKNAEWGGRFGVKRADYPVKIGWDPGHFGLRRAA